MTDLRAGQAHIFISYQRADEPFARQVREHLAAAGLRTWMDQYDIPVGAYWPDEIDKGLSSSDIVVGILSPDAVESRNVKNEWDWAIANDKRLLLLMARPCGIPHRYISINYIDATKSEVSGPLVTLLATLGVAPTTVGSADDGATIPAPRHGSRRAARRVAPLVVGRDREQADLTAALDEMLDGRGSLVLVGGEAGIGKTTLTGWLAWKAEQEGAIVVSGGCYDLSTTRPYGPWVELLWGWPEGDGLPPVPRELRDGEELDTIRNQNALFTLIATFLVGASATQPLVLLLEDLHWADQASLDLLRSVVHVVTDRRLLLVVTYRDEEVTRRHPLYALLPGLAREPNARRVSLRRLDADATGALVATRFPMPEADRERLVDYVHRVTEGNPFFASEVLLVLEEAGSLALDGGAWRLGPIEQAPTPALVRQVIDGRLARLGDDARRLLELAAVIGHEAPVDLWVEASGESDTLVAETLERAVETRLVEELAGGERFRFSHALIRETLYEGLVSLRRRAWHRKVGDILAASPRSDPDAVAHHFQQSGDPRAFDWLVRAGERAQRAYAWNTAVERLEAAATLVEHDPERVGERAWLLYRIGRLHRETHVRVAIGYLERASRLAAQSGDVILQAFLAFDIGYLHSLMSNVENGNRLMRAGIVALDAIPVAEFVQRPGVAHWVADVLPARDLDDRSDPQGLLSVADLRRGALVLCLAEAGEFDAVLEIGEPHIQRLMNASRPAAVESSFADTCAGVGLACLERGQVERARELLETCVRSEEATGHFHMVAGIHATILAEITLVHDVLDRSARGPAAARISAALRHANLDAQEAVILAPLRLLEGDWQELARDLGPIMELMARTYPYWWKALLLLPALQGNLDITEQQIRFVLPNGRDTQPGSVFYACAIATISVATRLELSRGSIAAARAWLETRDRWVAWAGDVRSQPEGELLWAEYFRASDDPDAARQRVERSLELAADPRQPLAILAAQRLLGELDSAVGRYREAESMLTQSLDLATACAAPFERALTLVALAELELVSGRQDSAQQRLAVARETCERLGARPALERIARLAAALR